MTRRERRNEAFFTVRQIASTERMPAELKRSSIRFHLKKTERHMKLSPLQKAWLKGKLGEEMAREVGITEDL